jgi:hypothetical protein
MSKVSLLVFGFRRNVKAIGEIQLGPTGNLELLNLVRPGYYISVLVLRHSMCFAMTEAIPLTTIGGGIPLHRPDCEFPSAYRLRLCQDQRYGDHQQYADVLQVHTL